MSGPRGFAASEGVNDREDGETVMKKRGAILTIRIDGLYIGRKKIAGIDPGDGSSPVIMGDIVVNHYKLEKIPFQLGRMTDNKKAYGAN